MAKRNARLITPGNLEDHLDLLADCDWIIEVVIERADIKQKVYRQIDSVRKAGSIVSSNASLGGALQGCVGRRRHVVAPGDSLSWRRYRPWCKSLSLGGFLPGATWPRDCSQA